jgi:hypothetical protein
MGSDDHGTDYGIDEAQHHGSDQQGHRLVDGKSIDPTGRQPQPERGDHCPQ